MKFSKFRLLFLYLSLLLLFFPESKAEEKPNISHLIDQNKKKYSTAEERGFKIVKKWKEGMAGSSQPFPGENGKIQFVFGTQEPVVVCAVLHVSDIVFQPHEKILSVQLGDKVRWSISSVIEPESKAPHLFVKPFDTGLKTNLIVVTSIRVYHISLISTEKEYFPLVGFVYPDSDFKKVVDKAPKKKKKILKLRSKNISTALPAEESLKSNLDLQKLNFDYELIGDAPWMPLRVYNNGKKTVIDMPEEIENTNLPAVFLLKKEGGLFRDDEISIVNNRFLDRRYIIDSVPEKMILLSGIGNDQEKVIIIRR